MSANETTRQVPASSGLETFVAAVERIHAEHRVSFVAAGDEKIFAYGGDGFVVVFNERLFGDLVELETPRGKVELSPRDEGGPAVTAAPDGVDADELLGEAASALLRYYAKRYW